MTKSLSRLVYVLSFTLCSQFTFSQVGIGTTTPNADAILDVTSTNAGLLLPRIALTATTSPAPLTADVAGMTVYNTATAGDVTPGFYYNDGTDWIRLGGGATSGWGLTGNAGTTPATNFLGTTDAQDLALRTNNTEKLRITSAGAVGIGITTPNAALEVSSTTGGLLPPQVSLTDITVSAPVVNPNGGGAPVAGTFVWNTAAAGISPNNVVPGLYYWDGARWVAFAGSPGGLDWSLLGNGGTSVASAFLGTIDTQDLALRTDNIERFRLDSAGRFLFNNPVPAFAFDLVDIDGGAGGTTTGYEYAFNVYGESSVGSSAAAAYVSQRGEGAAIWAENFSATGTMASIFAESEAAPVPAIEGRSNFADTQSIGVLGVINITGTHDSKGVVGRAVVNNANWGYGVYGEGNWYGIYTPDNLGAGGTKTFLIDHPLDPENKLLRHYSVESNEVLNMYRGVVVFDASGNAKVKLPHYFTAININYSYQLSAIGQPMPNMYVKKEIDNNGAFIISGGASGAKVSWTVYANRNDKYMQKYPEKAIPELDKKQGQKGKYMQPKVWDKPDSMGINYIKHNPNLSKEKK